MPQVVTCPACQFPVSLPDDWAAPGFTCPRCRQPAQLPRRLPAPLPPPPFDLPPEPRRVVVDHRPQGSFAAGFGGAFGCLSGVAVFCLLALALVFAVCAGAGRPGRGLEVEVERPAATAR